MMRVIFLDIDGVLNVYCQNRDQYGCTFHDHFVNNLKYLINQTDAKIVISSSWKLAGLQEMIDMWLFRQLPGEVIDITPNLTYGPSLNTSIARGYEIEQWLELHPEVINYVIIDDDDDMLDNQMNNFVKTSDNSTHIDCVDIGYGLTKECTESAIKILKQ